MNRLTIKDFMVKILSYIKVDDKGNKVVRKDASRKVTTDFMGKIISRGDVSSSLLYIDEKK